MLTFRADFPQTSAALSRIVNEHRGVREQVMGDIGRALLFRQRLHYGQLVRTGSSNGVTWPTLAASTLRDRRSLARRGVIENTIVGFGGYRTGAIAAGFRYRVNLWGRRIILGNVQRYAGAFSARRPIYPTAMPSEWIDASEAATEKRLGKHYGPTRRIA